MLVITNGKQDFKNFSGQNKEFDCCLVDYWVGQWEKKIN